MVFIALTMKTPYMFPCTFPYINVAYLCLASCYCSPTEGLSVGPEGPDQLSRCFEFMACAPGCSLRSAPGEAQAWALAVSMFSLSRTSARLELP